MQQTYRETRRRFFDHPGVRIEGAAARTGRNCRTPEALTPELQIVLTLRGAFVYERGSSRFLLTANQALFIAPGDVSRDRFVDGNPLDYMLVTPHPELVGALVGERVAGEMRKMRDTRVSGASARLQHAASALWNLCHRSGSHDNTELAESVVDVLSLLFSSPAPRGRAGRGRSSLIGEAKELIGAGRERWSLTGIAAQLQVSPAYLTDLFRRHEGVSIARYQRRLRLSRALVELPHTEDIAALALDLGFSSHAHFSTAFRATYGETPSRYRERF
ncbi:MAG TPA: AraC family transcriptional regulator [Steroidobacteraceae bacterium]|nr:AraC family transcriptional regulator [Steroidobacteraceae bacterium]